MGNSRAIPIYLFFKKHAITNMNQNFKMSTIFGKTKESCDILKTFFNTSKQNHAIYL